MEETFDEIERLEHEVIQLIDDIEAYENVGHPKIMYYKQDLYAKRARLNELKRAVGIAS